MNGVIFDCDGVLADTERDGHRVAFNQMFAEYRLPVRWSETDYADQLRVGGGKERLAALLTPAFVRAVGLPDSPRDQTALVARWHRRKTEIYLRMVDEGRLPARPGIVRLVGEALTAGWTLAVASTSAEVSVRAVLKQAVGPQVAERFHVFAGDVVPVKKPSPDIYYLAVQKLGLPADQVVVIEDSGNGCAAAVGAGLTCVVTVNDYTRAEDFTGARLVVSSLGDPDEPPVTVLSDPGGLAPNGLIPGGFLALADLVALTPSAGRVSR